MDGERVDNDDPNGFDVVASLLGLRSPSSSSVAFVLVRHLLARLFAQLARRMFSRGGSERADPLDCSNQKISQRRFWFRDWSQICRKISVIALKFRKKRREV